MKTTKMPKNAQTLDSFREGARTERARIIRIMRTIRAIRGIRLREPERDLLAQLASALEQNEA